MAVLRMWIEPSLHLISSTLSTASGMHVILETVTWHDDHLRSRECSLMSMRVPGDDATADYTSHWRQLHALFEMVAFTGTCMGRVISARVEPSDLRLNQAAICVSYPGAPAEVATMHLPYGYPQRSRLILRDVDDTDGVKAAISWYLRALRSSDPFEKAFLLWMVLERLAPPVKSQDACPKCEKALECGQCGPLPPSPRVIRSIIAFAKTLPTVTEKEIKRLYGLRSELVHGKVSPDQASAKRHGSDLMRLLQIAQVAIKSRLGWSWLLPPDFDLRKGLAGHTFKLTVEMTFKSEQAIKIPLHATVEAIQYSVPGVSKPLPAEVCGI